MDDRNDLITLTADIVSAHLANNTVAVGDVADLIKKVHGALQSVAGGASQEPEGKSHVVSVRASIKPDYLVCMECGSKQKMLRRHINTAHGMTPDEYRRAYGLAESYPMTAPNYAEQRRQLALSSGLGLKGRGRATKRKPQ